MPRSRTRIPLDVYLNARLVGRLRRHANAAMDFQYDRGWLAWEHTMPLSLSLPLREDRYTGERLTPVLENLLPDSEAIRRRVAERVGADGIDAFGLLARIGRDCVGAMQFLPEGEKPPPAGTLQGRPVTNDEIARKLADLGNAPLGLDEDGEFRISLAGAQEKTALLRWKRKWHVPHGSTATTHILKPPIGVLANGIDLTDSVENEYLCLKLTAALGLPSTNVSIAIFKGRRALVVERFDRQWTRDGRLLRLPQEDCCQALSVPPSRKYESQGGPGMAAVLDLLKGSDDPEADRRMFFKAQIVFWLLGATDGHAKNFSVFLRPGGRFRLTPLYDVMSAQPRLDVGQIRRNQMKLALAIGDNRHYAIHEIAPRHFVQTAARCGIAPAVVADIFEELLAAAGSPLDRALDALPKIIPDALTRSIVGGLRSRMNLIELWKARQSA